MKRRVVEIWEIWRDKQQGDRERKDFRKMYGKKGGEREKKGQAKKGKERKRYKDIWIERNGQRERGREKGV